MKKYFKWLIANSNISRAKFKIFWFIVYILMFCVVIHEAVADTPWALLGLIPLGAMMLYQWLEFKSDTTDKVGNSVCPKCGTKGYKTTLTENSYACKKCETWWTNGC